MTDKYRKNTYRMNEVDSRFIQNLIQNDCALHMCQSHSAALTFSSRIRSLLHHTDERVSSGVKISCQEDYVVAWLRETLPYNSLNEIIMSKVRDSDSITSYNMEISGVREMLKGAISSIAEKKPTTATLKTVEEMKEYIRKKFMSEDGD